MHWIVNAALAREAGFHALIHHLESQGQPFTLVTKPPMVPHLVSRETGEPVMLDAIDCPVFVVGTTSMKAVSADHRWSPGYVDAPTQEECVEAWGGHRLNADAVFGAIGSIVPPADRDLFVRPDEGSKAFTGRVVAAGGFDTWRSSVIRGDAAHPVPADQRVMVAGVKTIWSEYRCIVVDGRYVTGSRYRTGRTVSYSPEVGARFVRFVEERVAEWNPRRALCIDVADTPDGIRIIETNDVSSCGFYAMDMGRFAAAIGSMDPES